MFKEKYLYFKLYISDIQLRIKKNILLVLSLLNGLIKKQTHYFANKGRSSQGYSFSSGHVWM